MSLLPYESPENIVDFGPSIVSVSGINDNAYMDFETLMNRWFG